MLSHIKSCKPIFQHKYFFKCVAGYFNQGLKFYEIKLQNIVMLLWWNKLCTKPEEIIKKNGHLIWLKTWIAHTIQCHQALLLHPKIMIITGKSNITIPYIPGIVILLNKGWPHCWKFVSNLLDLINEKSPIQRLMWWNLYNLQ